jgi:hypothetical protein
MKCVDEMRDGYSATYCVDLISGGGVLLERSLPAQVDGLGVEGDASLSHG